MAFSSFPPKAPGPPPRDVRALTVGFTAPAVHLVGTRDPRGSYIGGVPHLPLGIQWPARDGRPLDFLARIDLHELSAAHRFDWLPPTGVLLFFYDAESQPWGFDPDDKRGWAVIFLREAESLHADLTIDSHSTSPLPQKNVVFRRIDSYPSFERDAIAGLNLTDPESDLLSDLQQDQYQNLPQHQTGGYPAPVQGDAMELESQLANNGVYCGDARSDDDPRVASLRDGSKDWRLLLQFDSDDDLNVMWGDCGKLYFWVREQDARLGRFDAAWVVLQCS